MTHDQPRLRLGIIADPQYADLDPDIEQDRYFRQSLGRLQEAVDHFNTLSVDAVVVLGDLIDRGFGNLAPVLAVLDQAKAPRILLPGNHDFIVAPEHLPHIHASLGMPSPYHEVALGGVRLIVTDGSEISLFAPPIGDDRRAEAEIRLAALKADGAPNAMHWNAGMSRQQLDWVRERLAVADKAGEPVILLGHYPLHPFSDHALWDAQEVADLIAMAPAALAYLCGHHHQGNHGFRDGTHFVNFCGMVDTATSNAFAVLSLYADRIEITGHGREPSRNLPLAKETQQSRIRSNLTGR